MWRNLARFNSYSRRYSTKEAQASTIFALSSGKGRSGVAVIRISGPDTRTVLQGMVSKSPPAPRVASLRILCDPRSKERLDQAMVIYFKGPRSFTGEDVAEFHVHGGPAVVRATLDAISSFLGVRPAEAGEFTKRAFINGKMDLTTAEAVADLIHAETEAQRRQAFRQMSGSLAVKYADWRERLLKSLAFLEAYIDFGEEEQLEPDIMDRVKDTIAGVEEELKSHLNDNRRGERLRDGVHVTIVGEPNVGKSSLLNALCQKPAAIVSPIAGTTRDIVESAFDLAGYPVLLSDTAGLRLTDDVVESEGVRRALTRAESSDLVILLLDGTKALECAQELGLEELSVPDRAGRHMRDLGLKPTNAQKVLVLLNKMDLLSGLSVGKLRKVYPDSTLISCTTGTGMEQFLEKLVGVVEDLCGNPAVGEASLTQQRHRTNLEACYNRLRDFWEKLAADDVTLAAHEVQQALRQLGKITGKVQAEEVLDVIFRDFCIGK